MPIWSSPGDVEASLRSAGYIPDSRICTSLFLSELLGKPLLVEGPPGSGKTELAKSVAQSTGMKLHRIQCHEGMDYSSAFYEWNYQKQLLFLRTSEANDMDYRRVFSEEFLIKRPILESISGGQRSVLLIDEIDRSDEEFEGMILEFLGEFQVSIPELGTIRASQRPVVIVTSNRTRELSDALRRRCIYLFLDYPDAEREVEIVMSRAAGISPSLARAAVEVTRKVRRLEGMVKKPGISETIDLALSMVYLGLGNPEVLASTIAKNPEDYRLVVESNVLGAADGREAVR
ncbi:AAA family ATPase [Thermogymnomonas acidicola]|uniref:AAA family ATPase n=1 Tax=Thermogymnomonas acidicola TaxID=399579 RepID=UPI0016645A17|nr:MoxR family ATPase [Thermogymnomonas acidicola]